jgi:hypothetical protein
MQLMTREKTLDEQQMMWASLTHVETVETVAFVTNYAAEHLRVYEDLPLHISGIQATREVGKQWRRYLPWLHGIQGSNEIAVELLDYYFKTRVRGLKFTQYGRKQKLMYDICKRICMPIRNERPVIVAFGAGMFSSTSRGHCPRPVKGVRTALERRRGVEVVDVNEDYPSQLCSECHQKVNPMYSENSREAIYSVRRCVTANCQHTLWNRDTNAARNIMHIFLHELTHGERPEVFTRAYQQRLRSAHTA